MKPALQLKLSQHLALTPQLQQSIKLLQLSTVEMQQEIENYLLENPMLERDDDGASESFVAAQQFDAPRSEAVERADHDERDERDARDDREQAIPATPTDVDDDRWSTDAGTFTGAGRDDEDDNDSQDIHGGTPSLREHLTWQLGMTQLSDRDRSLVRFLIEALDDDGYLSSPLEELWETLPPEYEIELEELEIALRHIQSFDPTGIGARSPQECQALQLKSMPDSAENRLALLIVEKHLELLAARDFAKIKRFTGCDDAALKAAHALIVTL
ncbi:MAG: RNA polymerase factor sigma-54, partial [Azonexus sp.]